MSMSTELKLPLRTLFLTREPPYPIRGGLSLRCWQNINALMKYGPVAVFSTTTPVSGETSLPGVEVWKSVDARKQRSNWEKVKYGLWWLDSYRLAPDVDWAYAEQADRELAKLCEEFKPNLIIVEEVWLYPYFKTLKQCQKQCQSKIIFDNLNVELSLLQQNLRSVSGWKASLKGQFLVSHLARIERAFSHQADQIWVCSDEDSQLMQQLYGRTSPIQVIPNSIDVSYYDAVRLGDYPLSKRVEHGGPNILFLGTMLYPPNTVAVNWLLKEIYPQLKKRYPTCRLLLVGRGPTPFMIEAANRDPDIVITGGVPDVRPYLAAADLMLVPLREGGGTRFKILEAFAAGCPVISTTKGVEGLRAEHEKHLLIQEDGEGMIAATDRLLSNPALGKELAHAAYELVLEEYSWKMVSRKINKAVTEDFLP